MSFKYICLIGLISVLFVGCSTKENKEVLESKSSITEEPQLTEKQQDIEDDVIDEDIIIPEETVDANSILDEQIIEVTDKAEIIKDETERYEYVSSALDKLSKEGIIDYLEYYEEEGMFTFETHAGYLYSINIKDSITQNS